MSYTSYIYNDAPLVQDSTGAGFGKLSHVSIGNGQDDFVYLYDYDELNRLTWRAEHHRDISNGILVFTENYSYHPITGMPDSHTFPSGYTVGYDYAANGMLRKVKEGVTGNVLWENKGVNQRGQITGYDLGNGLSTPMLMGKVRPAREWGFTGLMLCRGVKCRLVMA